MALNRALRDSFSKIGRLYDAARPDYPEELIEDIVKISGIKKNSKILDIGCGTGKSTLPFAKRGYQVVALDLNENIISIARENLSDFGNVTYVVNSFEDADLMPNHFNLIISGQAFHWLKPEIAYAKSHRILKENGHLAMFLNRPYYEDHYLLSRVNELYLKYCPEYNEKSIEESRKKIINRIQAYDFELILTKIYTRELEYGKTRFTQLQHTNSWINSLGEEHKNKFFGELSSLLGKEEELLHLPYETVLIIARKNWEIR